MKVHPFLKYVGVIILVFLAIHGAVTVGKYVGYASFQGESGNIYELLIKHHIEVDQWAGQYGVAVRVDGFTIIQSENLAGGDVESENLLFDCLEPDIEHEIYATVSPTVDLSSATPAVTSDVDAYYGINTSAIDSVTNTFTSNITFSLGSLGITAPGTYTYTLSEAGNSVTFATAAIRDAASNFVFAVIMTSNFTEGFNGDVINYQALLPVFTNQSETTYNFFTDPNDVCPAGDGDATGTSELIGNVTDQSGNFLENVIVEVAGTATLTNSVGFYNMSPQIGTHRIYGILSGYKTYINNVTIVANTTNVHNIVMIEESNETQPGPGQGVDDPGDQTDSGIGPGEDTGPGQSDGEDVGPGEAPPVVERPEQIEGTDYIISLSEIKRKIRLDSFHQENLYIYSFKKSPVLLTFELEGENLTDIITLDTDQLVIPANGNDNVIITIWGKPPVGTFTGNLTIDGEINATIPIEIEVLPKDRLPVEALLMNLETNQKNILPGEVFKFKTDLRNMLIDQPYPVNLLFTIQPLDGNGTVWSFQTNVYLKTAFSLIRSVELPKDLPDGDYVLRASASYLGLSSSTDTIFHVDIPFWSRKTFGLKNWIWAIILFTLLAAGLAGFFIWRNIQSKKKYHLKVELSELPKPGPRNVFVGKIAETEHKTYFNLENFKVHTIVAGSTGGGKSVSAQIIVEEALEHDVSVICFDPTAQWTGMLRPCKDKTMLSLYPFFGMKKTDARAYNGNIRMITDPYELIDIKKYAKPGEIQVFAGHKLDPKDMDIVVANAIREIFHANFQESKPLKILFIFDEVHRLLPKFGGSGDGFLQIERGCREFRKWGLGIVLVSQVLSDFMGTIKANINTEIQMRTRDEGDLERIRQKYGEDVLRSLVKATVGSGMVENPAYNRGKPYFIAFRPLKHSVERMPDDEIEEYNKYNDMVDAISYSLDQLEEEKVDVFDLKLELKLALDKVKQGNFNMVQIYLEGLTPRVDKLWEKIGKTPKKFERKRVDKDALEADLKKAQEEREEYEAEHKEDDGKEEKKEWEWGDDAPPDKLLSLKNGMVVLSLASMYDEISAMKDDDWEGEVNENQNNLAQWVLDATGLEKLAANMFATTDKEETLKLLNTFKDGGELPDKELPAAGGEKKEEAADKKEEATAEKTSEEAPTEKDESKAEEPAEATPAETAAQQEPPASEPQAEASAEPTQPATADAPAAAEQETPKSPEQPAAPAEKTEAPPPEQPTPEKAEVPPEQPAPPEEKTEESAGGKEPTDTPAAPPEKPADAPAKEAAPATQETPAEQPAAPPATADAPAAAQPPAPSEAPAPEQPAAPPPTAPPAEESTTKSIDDLVAHNPEEYFNLEDGKQLRSVKELVEYLPTMPEEIFTKHVGDNYNHFADWVRGVFHDDTLAGKMAQAKTRDELAAVMAG